jgi:hypothetical protein
MAALEFHELAGLFPLMDNADANAFAVDILENGLREPIVLFEEKILDGRNRYNACIATGVEPTFRPYLGDDPTGFVVSLNYHRRHLNAGQRALFAEGLTTIGHGGDRRSDQVAIGKITQAAAAKIAKVSPRSVAAAKALKRDAVPDVVEAVERGSLPIADAAAFAKQVPTLEQARLIEEHGSPADAVKASKLAVKAKADRAEQAAAAKLAASKPKVAAEPTAAMSPKPGDDPVTTAAKLIGLLEVFGRVNVSGTVARMSNDDRIAMMTQLVRANSWINQTVIEVAISGGANLGKLAPVSLRLEALEFLKAATARIETELGRSAVTGTAS